MTEDESILKSITPQLRNAVSWSNSKIAAKQETALRYYKREALAGDENPKNKLKSKYVSPRVQQSVDWLGSQLIRIFETPNDVVVFKGFGGEDEPIARQQTRVANWVLTEKNKHGAYLTQWIQDGLLTGLGVVTAEFEVRTEESLPRMLKNVPNEALEGIFAEEEAGRIVIEEVGEPRTVPGPQGIIQTRDFKIREIRRKPCFTIEPVAPEDFIVSKDAKFDSETGGISAKIQGHRKLVTRGDLLEMGYDKDKIKALPNASDKRDGIALERTKDLAGDQGVGPDDVEIFQIYTKAKLGKDKKARHYRVTIGGDIENRPVLIDYQEVSRFYPYAAFVPFQISNTLFGLGVADRVKDEHVSLTRMNRITEDNLHMAANPRQVVNQDVTNMDDLMNPHPDQIIRSSQPDGGISFVSPPFVGQNAMMVADKLAESIEYSTGVGPSMMALDASDLQRTSATAANIRSNSQQLLVEGISRWFAATGYIYLTKIVIDLLVSKPDEAQELIARLTNGENIPLDQFDPEFDFEASDAFGALSRDQTTAQLSNIFNYQMQTKSAGLRIAGDQEIYQTLSKLAETAGFKNTRLFFVDPATLPPIPPTPQIDPNAGLVEMEKLKAQLDAQAAELKRQFDMQKFIAEEDRKRDEMAQNFALKIAELEARYGANTNEQQVYAQQTMPRDPMGNMQ